MTKDELATRVSRPSVVASAERYLIILLAAALVVRLALFFAFQPWLVEVLRNHVIVADASQYHALAKCIADDWSFCGNASRTPGFPLYVSAFYWLFGEHPWIVLLSHAFLDLFSLILVFRIGELVFNKRVGLIASTFYAFEPTVVFATATLLTETLFVCLLLAGVLAYLRAVIRGKLIDAATSGILLALASLVRPSGEYVFYLLALFVVVWAARSFAHRLRIVAVLSVTFAATLSPWLYRNYMLYDTARISSIQGENLLFWQVTYAKAWETKQPAERVARDFETEAIQRGLKPGGNPFRNAEIAQKIAVEYITSHPELYAYRMLIGISNTMLNLGTAQIVKTMGYQPTNLPDDALSASKNQWQLIVTFFSIKSRLEIAAGLYVLALLLLQYSLCLLGMVELASTRRYAILLLLTGVMAYFAISSGPIGLGRFRLPITPFCLLIGSVFVDSALRRRSLRIPSISPAKGDAHAST